MNILFKSINRGTRNMNTSLSWLSTASNPLKKGLNSNAQSSQNEDVFKWIHSKYGCYKNYQKSVHGTSVLTSLLFGEVVIKSKSMVTVLTTWKLHRHRWPIRWEVLLRSCSFHLVSRKLIFEGDGGPWRFVLSSEFSKFLGSMLFFLLPDQKFFVRMSHGENTIYNQWCA